MLYLRDYITLPSRAIKNSDAKAFEQAMNAEYMRTGSLDISFADVPYVVTAFVRASIVDFLYSWHSRTFEGRAAVATHLNFHDYQSDVQRRVVEECIRAHTDEEFYNTLQAAWGNFDKYSIYDVD
jgi:hypothetical protein